MDDAAWFQQLIATVGSAKWCNDNHCGTCKAATACVVVMALLGLVRS